MTTVFIHKKSKVKKIVFGNFKFLPTQWHFCNKTVYFFSVKWLIFMTSNGSVNFSLQFKTVYRFLSWKIRILAFSHFHTWESSILLNLTNYFHHFSLGSAKSTHFNDFPSSKHVFYKFQQFFIYSSGDKPKNKEQIKSDDTSTIMEGKAKSRRKPVKKQNSR